MFNLFRNRYSSVSSSRRAERKLALRRHPFLEALEDRHLLAVFTVINVNDAGPGSLRQALLDANGTAGPDRVILNIPGKNPHSIQVNSALPVISDPVEIDGTTQPGYQGRPVVIIDGTSATGGVTNGLEITAGNSTVRGLVISLFTGAGLVLRKGGGNVIEGNYIGTNVSGTLPNRNLGEGIAVVASSGNQIGGTTIAGTPYPARNVVSGNELNGIGLHDGSNNNRVQGNYVGTTFDGSTALGNLRTGVAIDRGSRNNLVGTDGDGTDDAAEGNVISGNAWDGIVIAGPAAGSNKVAGNRIGLAATTAARLGNGRAGVWLGAGTQLNVIGTDGDGGADDAERNAISANTWDGIRIEGANTNRNVVAGNYIGIGPAGTGDRGNGEDGIELVNGPRENRIGTNADGTSDDVERNVISGNGLAGVAFKGGSSSNVIAGNYIGTNATGTAALGNTYDGVYMDGRSDFNRVGTNGDGRFDTAERNVISGNRVRGINLVNVRSTRIAGNYIGTNAAGTVALSNGSACGFPGCEGVMVQSGSQSNVIGTNGDSADNVAERNIISGNTGFGVRIESANTRFNIVAGNFVGIDATGRQQLRNGYIGLFILQASRNRIGTDSNGLGDEAERNVIGANGFVVGAGVALQGPDANNNTVAGNYIGTDVNGAVALDSPSHLYGVLLLEGASDNLIGGTDPLAGNLISGNTIGAQITDPATRGNRIFGNAIGTQADRASRLGNVAHGVLVTWGASSNTIGGPNPGEGNVLAFNGGSGVVVVSGTGNAILGNFIHSNVGLGIDLGADGITTNDYQDPDDGPNQFQNYPELWYAIYVDATYILGTLNSLPNTTFTIDFFASTTLDPTGFGQGERYLGFLTVATDENGDAFFVGILDTATFEGEWVTATATNSTGNTSEFSAAIPVEPSLSPGRGPGDGWESDTTLDGIVLGLLAHVPGSPMDKEESERSARNDGRPFSPEAQVQRAPLVKVILPVQGRRSAVTERLSLKQMVWSSFFFADLADVS